MIDTIITDFDGTLVDTFEANFKAYQMTFAKNGITLTEEKYRECFGYRYDRFMQEMGIEDANLANAIREAKKQYYPDYFQFIKPNKALIELIEGFKNMGNKTAIASTASRNNLMNVVNYFNFSPYFDLIYAGQDIKNGKPSPEIYLRAMSELKSEPENTLIFEDSEVGIKAAKASGAHCIIVSQTQFEI